MRSLCGLALCLGLGAGAQSTPAAALSMALPGQDLRTGGGDCSASHMCVPLGPASFQHGVPKGFAVLTAAHGAGHGGLERAGS